MLKRGLQQAAVNQAMNQGDFKRSNDVSMDLGLFNVLSYRI